MPGLIRDASSANTPAVDAPAVDAPAVDAPAVDAPAIDAPAVEAPAVDAPAVDAPAVDAPAFDAPAVDAPAVDAPAVDAPAVDAPAVDAPPVNVHAAVNDFVIAHHDVQSEELQQQQRRRASFPYNYNTNQTNQHRANQCNVGTSTGQFFGYSLTGNQNPSVTYRTQNQQQNNISYNNDVYLQENVTVEHLPMSWPHFCHCCGPHCRCYRMTISYLSCDQINTIYNLIYSDTFQSNPASCSVNFVHIDQ